jgi:hypothetical protein
MMACVPSIDWNRLLTLDWGSVPDWVAALGSVVSLLVIYSGLRREMKLRRKTEDAVRGRQARLVSSVTNPRGAGVLAVEIANGSLGPIHDLTIAAVRVREEGSPKSWPALDLAAVRGAVTRLLPGESTEFSITLPPGSEMAPATPLAAVVEFTDEEGLRWQRIGSHQPDLQP